MTDRIGAPTLLHHRGVDLPLHPTNEVVWHKHDMHAAAQRAGDTFIRTIRMDQQLPFDDLWELTRKAPHDYLRLAEKTGSLCVFVSFGLAPLPAPGELTTYETFYTVNQLLPPGMDSLLKSKLSKMSLNSVTKMLAISVAVWHGILLRPAITMSHIWQILFVQILSKRKHIFEVSSRKGALLMR